jgi:hypothetical protein
MSGENSPVQPLDSSGGTDPRLANMLAGSMAQAGQPGGMPTQAGTREENTAVPGSLCPNCKNGLGKEVDLVDGKCSECGFDRAERLY